MADKFEHERMRGQQYELIGYLSRSAWALGAAGVLLVVSAFFGNAGGTPQALMAGAGVLVLLLAATSYLYARRLDDRRKAINQGKQDPELR